MENILVQKLKEYRMLYVFCMLVHIVLAVEFNRLQLYVLFGFNICSVIMYFMGTICMRRERHVKFWLIAAFIEIIAHAVLCNLYLGYGYGFWLYVVALIPVIYYVGFSSDSWQRGVGSYNALTIIATVIIVISCFVSRESNLVSNIFHGLSIRVFAINLSMCMAMLIYETMLFVYAIKELFQDLQNKNDDLQFLASYDALTKLRNRRSMGKVMEQYEQDGTPYCMILGDIDDFKRINDTYGHTCGDIVLQKIAEIIQTLVDPYGVACRWGGEEILILLHSTPEEGLRLAEHIRETIEQTAVMYKGIRVKVSMTFGFGSGAESRMIEKLVTVVDARLYIGKENGKNQVVSKSSI